MMARHSRLSIERKVYSEMSKKNLLILILLSIIVLSAIFLVLGPVRLVTRNEIHSNHYIQVHYPHTSKTVSPKAVENKVLITPTTQPKPKKIPLILLYHKLHGATNWWFKTTDQDFAHCSINCQVTSNRSLYPLADMVMFEAPRFVKKQEGEKIFLEYYRDWGEWPAVRGNNQQVRMFYAREPQAAGISGKSLNFAELMFNYTITFQKEADIFYPYGHTAELPKPIDGSLPDYAAGKSKLVLWIVSNCYARKRMEYKEELQKYIPVNMFGGCNKTHGDPCKRDYRCLRNMKSQYKFYLSFENHRCEQYITEKFWKALDDGMVPIAMGGAREIYERVAPPHSFIHVDDFSSPKELADYIKLLDKNNKLYNAYHHWRRSYRVQYENANCALCRLATEKPQKVTNITQLWDASKQCTY